MKQVYLDSNVFISLLKEEINGQLRPLFIDAEKFFKSAKLGNYIVILSELFFKEVKQACSVDKEKALEYFKNLGVKTSIIFIDYKTLIKESKRIGIHYPDNLHAAIAIKSKCDCIVTFNIKDFGPVESKIQVFDPADFV